MIVVLVLVLELLFPGALPLASAGVGGYNTQILIYPMPVSMIRFDVLPKNATWRSAEALAPTETRLQVPSVSPRMARFSGYPGWLVI